MFVAYIFILVEANINFFIFCNLILYYPRKNEEFQVWHNVFTHRKYDKQLFSLKKLKWPFLKRILLAN